MQGIYTHIPETNYVPRVYSVAAILLFLFMVLISLVSVLNLLYFYIIIIIIIIIIINSSSKTSDCEICNYNLFRGTLWKSVTRKRNSSLSGGNQKPSPLLRFEKMY